MSTHHCRPRRELISSDLVIKKIKKTAQAVTWRLLGEEWDICWGYTKCAFRVTVGSSILQAAIYHLPARMPSSTVGVLRCSHWSGPKCDEAIFKKSLYIQNVAGCVWITSHLTLKLLRSWLFEGMPAIFIFSWLQLKKCFMFSLQLKLITYWSKMF